MAVQDKLKTEITNTKCTMQCHKKYGLIPFYIPHAGCPQQCVFCNQHRIASDGVRATAVDVKTTIAEYVGTQRNEKYWEVAFYGGSFSALPREVQISLLTPAYEALQAGQIDGIRCSTRPDALSEEAIDVLVAYGVDTVEVGVQSMNEAILTRAKRGHTATDVVVAVRRLQKRGLTVGIQLLPGLPGETWLTLVHTAVAVGRLQPDFVRIYPVLVIEDTELADDVARGLYIPLTVTQAVKYSAFLKTYFEDRHIEVIRTGLQSTPELDAGKGLVGGPYEPAMGELVVNYQWQQKLEYILQSHREAQISTNTCHRVSATVIYPRTLTSKLRGEKQRNMEYFAAAYSEYDWHWCQWGSRAAKEYDILSICGDGITENVCLIIDNIRYTVI
ncbi:Oxygen-independent coproporphyrinogen-III oxidase 2 [Veillonella criceti]|uniref:Oxygen-independent coproporphyrinogen-III oxidase 2 n=2 Tax=Veillonella criceti TaxID=103891 RepID=A0A380NG27_9FIRM|nr:Oxygen-independent coproporphyrinogen-III oxidase 2 [Veillonella criceti]